MNAAESERSSFGATETSASKQTATSSSAPEQSRGKEKPAAALRPSEKGSKRSGAHETRKLSLAFALSLFRCVICLLAPSLRQLSSPSPSRVDPPASTRQRVLAGNAPSTAGRASERWCAGMNCLTMKWRPTTTTMAAGLLWLTRAEETTRLPRRGG